MKLSKEKVVLIVHPADAVGAPSWLVWRGIQHVIGYDSVRLNELNSLSEGEYQLQVCGKVFLEKGYMPNPMHAMPGITLNDWVLEKKIK